MGFRTWHIQDEMHAVGRKHAFVSEEVGHIVTSRRLRCAMLTVHVVLAESNPSFIIGETLEGAKKHPL